jgi:formate dehydrogenase major subunit
MSRYMFDNGQAKLDFLEKWVNGVQEFRKSLEPFRGRDASRHR